METKIAHNSTGVVGLMRQHPISVFVVLAYTLSWWPWIWFQFDPQTADAPILPIGPLIAALIILASTEGWSSVRQLLQKSVRWRIGLIWYVLALLLPFATIFIAVEINSLLGASQVADLAYPAVGEVAVRFIFIFLTIGIGEEIAWRGFLLDRLLVRHAAFKATLIVVLIHLIWHAPLFGVEYHMSNILPWAVTVFCFSIVISWIFIRTGGGLLPAMLMHTSVNTWAFHFGMFDGDDLLRMWWLWCILWVIVAIAVVAFTGTQFWRKFELDR